MNGFNNAAQRTPFFVILDLDTRTCAPEYRARLLPNGTSPYMILRVAVREIESWLMADRSGFSTFLGVSEAVVPRNPDALVDAKGELFSIVRRSRKRALKEAILPIDKTAWIGPDYNGSLIQYLRESWSRDRAMRVSPSLQRAVDALEVFRYP